MGAEHRVGTIGALAIGTLLLLLAYLRIRSRRVEDDPVSYRSIKRRSQHNQVLHQKNRTTYVWDPPRRRLANCQSCSLELAELRRNVAA